MRRLQFEKDKISTLIENMAEGFILIDVDKKVLMSNYSASKLLGADDDGYRQNFDCIFTQRGS